MTVKERKHSLYQSIFSGNLRIGEIRVRDEYRSLAASKVSVEGLREALLVPLQNSHFLNTQGQPKYKIDATLDLMTQSNTSYDTSVSVFVDYKISKLGQENEDSIFEETMLSMAKTVTGGLVTVLPVQSATEEAVKNNIKSLIERIDSILQVH